MTNLVTKSGNDRAATVELTATELSVRLIDGRTVSVPLSWYPRLEQATVKERGNWRLTGDGQGIHWPDIEEDISVEGLFAGRQSKERANSFQRWSAARHRR